MTFQAVKMRPGIDRESTATANEGTWFAGDKVRFRGGYPEKIGGWDDDEAVVDPTGLPPAVGSFWGVCRNLFGWLTLSQYNLLGVGTNLKYYIQNGPGGTLFDITPLRRTTAAGAISFAPTVGSPELIVSDIGHGALDGDFVTFSGATGLGGNVTAAVLNREYRITRLLDANNYVVTMSVLANASDAGGGGASAVAVYQINTGNETFTAGLGWGAGGWGGVSGSSMTGWGQAAMTSIAGGLQLRLWSSANFGERLLINPRGGPIYLWQPNANPNIFDRATRLVSGNAPVACNKVLVTDGSRFVVALGVNEIGSSVLDPMLVRWSAQEDYTEWTEAADNQAGAFPLSRGSRIVTGLQARQEILVWTDAALYSMQYQGPPFVFGFSVMAENISIIGPNAAISVNNVTYWMGVDKFYVYNGRVEALPCSLRKFLFGRINQDQGFQVFAGHNEAFSEVWWFYCSRNSNEIDSYVIYNYAENVWTYGSMGRTAWLDNPLRSSPVATNYSNQLLYHERGADDGSTNPPTPIDAFIESADVDIGDGDRFAFVRSMLPDVTFDGSSVNNPAVVLSLTSRRAPGAPYDAAVPSTVTSAQAYSSTNEFLVQQFTEQVFPRLRGRQFTFKVSSTQLGVAWQLGVPRVDIRTSGRRGN